MAIIFNTPKTAINTTTRDMQNLSSDCPPCPEVNLTTADVEYTANGEYTVTPEAGYDGLTQVDITVSVPSDINNQNKTVTPTTSSQSVTADSGYSGLGTVTVDAVTSSIDANIAAGNIKKNVSILGVTGTYDPQPTLQAKTVNPTISQQVITADSGNDGLSQVTVNAVTSAIDENIQPENILSGVEILGVTGTDAGYTAGYDDGYAQGQAECPAPVLETVTATYTTNDTYTITPTQGYDGIDEVTVTVNVSGSNCPDWSSIDWTCSDVTASGVADDVAYTASVKNNNTWQNDTNLVFAPKTSTSSNSGLFKSCNNLRYVGNLTLTSNAASFKELFRSDVALRTTGTISAVNATSVDATSMFESCSVLKKCTVDMTNVTDTSFMFQGCFELTNVTFINNPVGKLVNTQRMYSGCRRLTNIPLIDTSNVTDMSYMFQNMEFRQGLMDTVSQFDTSNVINMEGMFYFYSTTPGTAYFSTTSAPSMNTSSVVSANNMFETVNNTKTKWLVTIPQYDFSSVANISGFVKYQGKLENLGGFLNLGKSFISTDYATWHILDLSASTVLTKQSIMNVINNLAAPDDTATTDATLKLSSTSYALLDASDIAIATAKNWSVISA